MQIISYGTETFNYKLRSKLVSVTFGQNRQSGSKFRRRNPLIHIIS